MGKFKHILVSVAVLIVAMVSVAMVTVAMVSRAVLAHIHTCPPPMHAHNMLTVNIPQQKFAELQSSSVASYTNKATMRNTTHTPHTGAQTVLPTSSSNIVQMAKQCQKKGPIRNKGTSLSI